jgi:hypothetical protein
MAQDDASTASGSGIAAVAGQSTATNPGGTLGLRAVPRLIKFNGGLSSQIVEMMPATPGENGNAGQSRVVTIAFSLYESEQGGAPLWTETQNVEVDEQGHYTVLLGATSAGGLPLNLFATAKARWLGVQPQLPGVGEQSRVALVGVPYALKAADADTLGGKPASAYVTTDVHSGASSAAGHGQASTTSTTLATRGLTQAPDAHSAAQSPKSTALAVGGSGTTNHIPIWTNSTTLGNSALVQVGGKVGLGATAPATSLDVRSSAELPSVTNQRRHRHRCAGQCYCHVRQHIRGAGNSSQFQRRRRPGKKHFDRWQHGRSHGAGFQSQRYRRGLQEWSRRRNIARSERHESILVR